VGPDVIQKTKNKTSKKNQQSTEQREFARNVHRGFFVGVCRHYAGQERCCQLGARTGATASTNRWSAVDQSIKQAADSEQALQPIDEVQSINQSKQGRIPFDSKEKAKTKQSKENTKNKQSIDRTTVHQSWGILFEMTAKRKRG
jgi:hypothetical protein